MQVVHKDWQWLACPRLSCINSYDYRNKWVSKGAKYESIGKSIAGKYDHQTQQACQSESQAL